jgi:uncharacterized protein (TIGR02145 family)
VTLDAGEGYDSYLWSNGETTQSIEVSESGDYSVEVGEGNANEYSMSFDGDDDWIALSPITADALNVGGSTSVVLFYKGFGGLFSGSIAYAPVYPIIFRFEVNDVGNGMANIKTYHRSSDLSVNYEPASETFEYDGTTWNSIIVSVDNNNGQYTLYHNGNPIIDYSFNPSSFFSSDMEWGIGNLIYNGGGTNYFEGGIDNIKIYNTYLTQSDVDAILNCNYSSENPLHFWDFEEGEGEMAYDLTPNDNIGTINGATWSDEIPEQSCSACSSSDDITVTINPSGCSDSSACNFNGEATCDDGSCDYTCCPGPGCCTDGMYWDWDAQGCFITNPTDTNLDGCTDLNDLMDILSAYGDCALVEFASCGDLLEYQGYDYSTVQIGEQCWFAENLRAENYTDGTSIPLNSIENPVSGPNPNYKCFYGDDLSNVAENGMLYSWFASADSRGICPVGWHLPSLTDFEALTQEVGGVSNAGSALKAVYPTWNGNDDYGFTAIPSGYFNWVTAPYSSDPGYFFIESYAYYWSSESSGSNSAYYMILWSDQNSASLLPSNGNFAEDAMSVRCIKD